MKTLRKLNVRYLILDPQMVHFEMQDTANVVIRELLTRYPKAFRPVYVSPTSMVMVYQMLPEPAPAK